MVTIGFSPHQAEALPFIRKEMERHQTIVLEEPPSPSFEGMLAGTLSLDDYLMELESGFPEFDRLMAGMLREFHGTGRRILQVEPYLETLLGIHELFAAGKTPEDILKRADLREVYLAERQATGTLIRYYDLSVTAPFGEVVEAVKTFARADAARLTLRERLRAAAIKSIVRKGESVFVEAGYIHYPLYRYLRSELGTSHEIRTSFLMQPVISKLGGKRRNLGPGDILTLHYSFNCRVDPSIADLLAARSLIYIKLIEKEELLPGRTANPHAEDEVKVNRTVDGLSFKDCGGLFPKIRLASRKRAWEIVGAYTQNCLHNLRPQHTGSAKGRG